MQKSQCDEENGTLVALYDPVGRQADIAFILALLFSGEKASEATEIYPKTIGEFILQLNENSSDEPQIQAAINENIHVEELTEFYKQSKEEGEALAASRTAYLDLFSSFSYQDLADGTVGSLDGYLNMFFDTQELTDPFKELQKLNAIISSVLDGIGATQEGHDVVVSMINAAYENGANNTYFIYQDKLETILLQCQNLIDWSELASELADNTASVLQYLWSWTAALAKYGQGHLATSVSNLKPVAYSGLLDFIPTFFEKGFGIIELDGKVRVSIDELGRLLAKNIDSNGKSNFPVLKTQSALPFAKKLISWSNQERANTLPKLENAANDSPIAKLTLPNYSHRYVSFDADTNIALLGKSLDGALSMLSMRANIDVLMQLAQIDEFEQATQPNHITGLHQHKHYQLR
ncbi:hypothetical protein [Vibrio mexicanus]|uniref:hypothetical protein n=1 Tax=Vibrio mexicanus TaxID=1004326 RepID=UPI00063C826E|nr:hypothetical protein [Vibrio mexicanus]